MDNELFIPNKKHLKGEDGFKSMTIRSKSEIVDKIDHIAYATNNSRNTIVNMILEYGIKHCKFDENPKP